MFEVLGKFSKKQYLEWKNRILTMQLAEVKAQVVIKTTAILEKDIEIQKLKLNLQRNAIQLQNNEYNMAKDDYQAYRIVLEKELGFSLADTTVDEISLEIKKIPK